MKKILLDENLPKPLKRHFSGDFNVTTVSDKGWNSLENGELIESKIRKIRDSDKVFIIDLRK